MKEYGELMSLLLHYRERYPNDEDFRRFVIDSLRTFVYDLRDFDVEISLSLDCWRRSAAGLSRPPGYTRPAWINVSDSDDKRLRGKVVYAVRLEQG